MRRNGFRVTDFRRAQSREVKYERLEDRATHKGDGVSTVRRWDGHGDGIAVIAG
jgi:hypothetical protein